MKLKLKAKLMMFTAAAALIGSMAQAAIDGQSLAQSYLADGYSYVEVKVGPTQTKVEAIKGSAKVEVIYDNATGDIVKQEQSVADAEEQALVGSEVGTEEEDFEDDDSEDDGEDDSSDDSEDDSSDDSEDDSSDDSGDDSEDDSSDDSGDDSSDDSGSDDSSDD